MVRLIPDIVSTIVVHSPSDLLYSDGGRNMWVQQTFADPAEDFQNLASGIAYTQNSYPDTIHSADNAGFYNLKVELGN